MEKTFQLKFFNESKATQDWAFYLDGASVPSFALESMKGTTKYISVVLKEGAKVVASVTASEEFAAVNLNRKGDKLMLIPNFPDEWTLEQETGSQYLLTCKI